MNGTFTCQHGEGECASDVLELCTQYKLSGDINSIKSGSTSLAAWPFILCMERASGDPNQAESCWNENMADAKTTDGSSLSFETIQACAKIQWDAVQNAAASTTPSHDFVPWCLVDGVALQHPDQMLQRAVCDAYKGTKPSACKLLESKDMDLRCYNKD